MGGWAIAVTPPENRIIIQTKMGGSEQLILILAWSHPTGISAYLADQIRIAAKTDKRLSYVIHNGHIAQQDIKLEMA
jgi:hypothetical protein